VSNSSTSLVPDPTERSFDRIAILGLGVMGGSLARALAQAGRPPTVVGWSPDPAEREAALAVGALVEAPSEWRQCVAHADLVVLAAPLEASRELLPGVAAATPSEVTISDLVSLKAPLAAVAAEVGIANRWVGCHPMTGSEQSGFGASRADLYRRARVWTVASPQAASRVAAVHELWASLGARPEQIDAGEHDRLVAIVSHLPQLAANALAAVLADAGVDPDQLGPGGGQMTRLAGSSPAMWRDLLSHAPPELVRGLRGLAAVVGELADALDAGNLDSLETLMARTRQWRGS